MTSYFTNILTNFWQEIELNDFTKYLRAKNHISQHDHLRHIFLIPCDFFIGHQQMSFFYGNIIQIHFIRAQ